MFIFGIIYGILYSLKSLITWWAVRTHPPEDVVTIFMFLNLASIVIGWILLFIVLIVMYYVGKKLDLKANLKLIIISMLVGGFIGYFLVRLVSMPLFFIIVQREISLNIAVVYLVGDLFMSLGSMSFLFFTSFTAIAIAHIRKTGGDSLRGV